MNEPIPTFLFDRLAERGSRPRFVVDGKSITWSEHAETVRRTARFLASRGVSRGDRVAVFSANSPAAMAAALAIQATGATTVLVHASSTAEQAAYCLAHAQCRIAFVDDERFERAKGVEEIVSLGSAHAGTVAWHDALSRGRAFDESDPIAFDRALASVRMSDVAILLYTSGTTGEPKGVPLTHENLVRNWREWIEAVGMPRDAVNLAWLPMTHVFGFGELICGDFLGFTTHLVDPRKVASALPIVRPSVFLGVPAIWEKLASMVIAGSSFAAVTGGNLQTCVSGAAALKREVKELFLANGVTLLEGYGLSETSPTLTVNRPGAFRFDSVGKPLPSVELRIAPDGEVLARGPSVFSGYFRDEDATRAAFVDDWFRTGDIGLLTGDGFLQIVDRKKELIVTSGGKNVAPSAIEARFRDDPFIQQLVLYGEGKKYLVAAVWADRTALDAQLEAHGVDPDDGARHALLGQRIERVNGLLPSHETIKRFAVVDVALEPFLTPSLKLKRRKVWESLQGTFEALYSA